MAQLFRRITGRQNVISAPAKAAVAIAIGDLVQIDVDNYVQAAGTDLLVGGIALDSKTSDSTTTNIRYDRLMPGDVVRAYIAAGSGGAASAVGLLCDIVGAGGTTPSTGIATTVTTNGDVRGIGWNGNAKYLDVEFTSLQAGGPDSKTSSRTVS